ncbi:MAG: V-type ATPase subunit [Nitrosomonadales bacterium]|nr:V-type ATPase subunit [Nitrosomonadales bacterium]
MNAADLAYLHTRVSMLEEKLLDPARIHALIELPADSRPPDGTGTTEAGRDAVAIQYAGDLDQSNVTILLRELALLIRPLSGSSRDLLGYWAHRFELSNLKAIIRGKMSGQPQQAIEKKLLDMGNFTRLPTAELLQSDNPAELMRRLERTPYADIAHQARHLLDQGEALFALDAAIDRRYFAGLARRGNDIGNLSGQLLRGIIGSIIDRVNLVWLLRYRFAYSLPPAQAYYLLIPASQRLPAAQLQQLAQRANFEEAIGNLPRPYDTLLEGTRNNTEVTLRLEFETWRIAGNVLHHSSFNVARALAYMVLRERDLRRLRAIIRGRNLHLAPHLIRAALGLQLPEDAEAELV